MNQISPIATIADHVTRWLSAFEQALDAGDRAALAQLFDEDCHWRDLMAFTWDITPHEGREAIASGLADAQPAIQASQFAIAADRREPRSVKRTGMDVFEAIFSFETKIGRGLGVLRLLAANPSKAFVIMTSLKEFKGFEEPTFDRRVSGEAYSRNFGGRNWSDLRATQEAFADREPAVLIIGAGHAGLSTAARLRLLGVDALIVDTKPRVGDVWRDRYHSLALHNEVVSNHLPYLPFPPHWPSFLPKDMVAGWFETYAWAMECNVWTGTTFVGGSFDDVSGTWKANVRRADGSERVLRPRHIVFANGIVGSPIRPELPGLDEFKGEVTHTHDFKSGEAWRGKRALVLGTGTSAHDVAQDLQAHDASVKLVQRGSTTVVSIKSASFNHVIYYAENLTTEDADLIASSATNVLLTRGYQLAVKRMIENDKELLAGLAARGFKYDFGEDGAGHQQKLRQRFGGYYLNCGASELVVSGHIGLLQYADIERFVPEGALMKDGTIEKVDLIVTATGYESQQELVRRLLGDEIADRVGPVWGLDETGELANMFRPTAQKGLWFIGGGFGHSRIYSHYLALQIKAREAGLVASI